MKASSSPMTLPEQILGGIFFALYFAALPLAATPLFARLSALVRYTIPDSVCNVILYYILFALTVIIFWNYLGEMTERLFSRFLQTAGAVSLGLAGFYGLNEISCRVLSQALSGLSNLNDSTVAAQLQDAPHSTALIVLFLAPFVEETLFRGYIFGNLQKTNRILAYLVSCLLFALLHVWQYALANQSPQYLLLMLQYVIPGFMLAWVYDRSETLWGSILLHAAVNAIALRSMA